MQQRPVVVGRRSLYSPVANVAGKLRWAVVGLLALILGYFSSSAVLSAEKNALLVEIEDSPPGYVARIDLNDPEEVASVLNRAESFYVENDFPEDAPPIVFVLHGPEVQIFNRRNYFKHKDIVDLAARLAAFNVVDVRVCQTQMRILGEKEEFLFPFVGTVPFGPAEVKRLLKEDYVYF